MVIKNPPMIIVLFILVFLIVLTIFYFYLQPKDKTNPTFTCPSSEWIDCMPSVDQPTRYQCEKPYLDWAIANCSDFKGVAF